MAPISVRWIRIGSGESASTQEVEGTYADPCAALAAIYERGKDFAYTEQWAFEVARLRAECDYWRAKQVPVSPGPNPEPPPEPEPEPEPEPPPEPEPEPEPGPAPEPEPEPTLQPPIDDDPAALDAPASPATESVEVIVEPAPTSYSALAPQLFAPPPYNLPPEWAPQLIDPGAAELGTDEQVLLDLLRGKPEPGQRGRPDVAPPAPEAARQGDPVDLFSGRFTISSVDMSVPTPFLPLQLIRAYRSGWPLFGPWGFNWDHNYNQYVRELTDGGLVLWTGWRLHEMYFARTGDGWAPEPGVHRRVLSDAPGSYAVIAPLGVRMRFERPSGWLDPERIPLVEIRDRHGNRQLLEYDSQDRLIRVSEHPRGVVKPSGRYLEFEYGDCGLLEGVRDHAGRRVRYDHHPAIEHLARVVLAPIAGYPDGVATEYVYDEDADHPARRHNIVAVIDADKNLYLENEYAGPEDLWAFNRVVRQRVGDDVYEFGYEQLQYVPDQPEYTAVPATRTRYLPPDRALHTYTFNSRGGLLDHRFRLNRDGSARIVSRQWEYDDQGNPITAVDPAGRKTKLTFDHENPDPCARGNLTEVTLVPALPYLEDPRVILRAHYDQKFQLPIKIIDAAQAVTLMKYDFDEGAAAQPTGRPTAVVRPTAILPTGEEQSSTIAVETNEQGLVTAIVSGTGVRHELSYWTAAAATGPEPREGLIRQVTLDVDNTAETTAFDYDDVGFAKRITDPAGSVTELIANAAGQVERVILPAIGGAVAELRFQYSPEGLPVRIEEPRGDYRDPVITGPSLIDEYHLDSLGRVAVEVTGVNTARPRETHRCYDYDGNPVRVVDPVGCVIRNTFDERGLLLEKSLGDGHTALLANRYSYEIDGALRRMRLTDGSAVRIERRDVWGRPTYLRDATGSLRVFGWGSRDQLESYTVIGDPGDGSPARVLARWAYDHDALGRLIRERAFVFDADPATAVELTTSYHYDADDRLRRVTTPTAQMSWDYDGLRRITRYIDPVGNTIRVQHDAATRSVELNHDEIEPDGTRTSSWRLQADERMRPRRIDFPGGSHVELVTDDRDLVVEERGPLGDVRRASYGLLGELEQVSVDPAGLAIAWSFEYDAVGRLLRFVDPTAQVTTWHRDAVGRPTHIAEPGGSSCDLIYDVGLLVERRQASGIRQLYQYRAGGLLRAIDCVVAGSVQPVPRHEFGHDGLGRLVRATAGAATVERRFDSLDRLIAERANGRDVGVSYDDQAGLVDVRYPDGRIERTVLNAAGRPVSVVLQQLGALGGSPGTQLAELTYAGASRLHAVRFPSGAESRYSYDPALRLVAVELHRGAELIESCRYSYDARHRRRLTELTGPPVLSRLHTFDAGDRLTAATWGFSLPAPPSGAPAVLTQEQQDQRIAAAEAAAATAPSRVAYGLNPADDRTSYYHSDSAGAGTVPYTYSAGHRLTTVGTETISHHADGSRAGDGAFWYDIDGFGRIVRIRDAATGAVRARYGYDPLFRVAQQDIDGTGYQRWFLGDGWIHQEPTGSGGAGPIQRTMHPWSPVPMSQREPGRTLTPLTDGALSTLAVVDGSGAVVERHRFDPFGSPVRLSATGAVLTGTDPGTAPVFGGMTWIGALGRYDTPARMYHPGHGLFLAPDPLGFVDSANQYAYAAHNPVDFIDPTGAEKQAGTGGSAGPSDAKKALIKTLGFVSDLGGGTFDGMVAVNAGLLLEAVTGGYYTLWKGFGEINDAMDRARAQHRGRPDVREHMAQAAFVAANEQFNPAYQAFQAVDTAWTEFKAGDVRAGVRTSTVLGATAATIVLTKRAGGGMTGASIRRGSAAAWSNLRQGIRTLIADKRGSINPNALLKVGEKEIGHAAATVTYSSEVTAADFARPRQLQLRHATRSFFEELVNNKELADALGGIFEAKRENFRTKSGWSMRVRDKFGEWWTWHHAVSEQTGGKIGKLWLAPSKEHAGGSLVSEKLHPRPNRGGGQAEIVDFNQALKDLGTWLGF